MDALRFDGVRTVSLSEVLPHARLVGTNRLLVRSLCIDSRRIQPGDLFVALPGLHHDGHHYIADALRQGAAGVIAERLSEPVPVPAAIVPSARQALARLCWALADYPHQKLCLIGITGTNGKTTTAYLTHAILAVRGPAALSGTVVRYDGAHYRPSGLTTPPPTALAEWLAAAADGRCWAAVMEVSSHALAQQRCFGLEFRVACLLNLSHDHLDYHGTVERYAAAKQELFRLLRADGRAVVNLQDEYAERISAPAADRRWYFALDGSADVVGRLIAMDRRGCVLAIQLPGEKAFTCHLRLIGRHNAQNAVAAAACAYAAGCDAAEIRRGLEAVRCVPGRLELVGVPGGPSVYVDYAHTPDALATALKAVRDITPANGRVIVVFGAGGDRDREKRPRMGAAASKLADVVVITDDNPRTEDPDLIVGDILRGCQDRGHVVVQRNRARAIELALELARAEDCVLVAGKGHETYQIVGTSRVPFDDREVVHAWARRHWGTRATEGQATA